MPLEHPMNGDSLPNRTVSGFPLSIGTGLAMETLFPPRQDVYDPERPKPEKTNVAQHQECWINVSTLFRNMVGAVNKEGFLSSSPEQFADTMLQEMEVIDSLFQNEGGGLCKPRYYYCTYESAKKKAPREVRWREDKTQNQLEVLYKLNKTLELISRQTEVVQKFDSEVKTTGTVDALIITHIPWDLLSYKNFRRLSLLETHSGNVKQKSEWWSKYYVVSGFDLSHLPFSRRLLLVFGDRVLIQPSDLKLRKLIIDIANKRQWHPGTSDAMVVQGFELDIKEPYVLQFLKSL